MAREQTLTWYRLKERKPELEKVIIMKVPDMPWHASDIDGDVKQVIGWMEKNKIYGNHKKPYHFETFGPASFFYNDVEEWAYL